MFPCGKECRSGRMSAPFCPVSPELPLNAATPQPSLRGPTFSALPEKVGKKRRWMRIRLYRGATEEPRRRTLRPTHENLSAKLHYSAACAGTTLPSGVVSTQEGGKTRCCGNSSASTHSPMVHSIRVLLYMFVGADVGIGPYNMLCNIIIAQVFRK